MLDRQEMSVWKQHGSNDATMRTWWVQQGLRLIQLQQVRVVKVPLRNGCQLLKDGHPVQQASSQGIALLAKGRGPDHNTGEAV